MTIELYQTPQDTQQMENQITETSMKEYFERIVNHVVGLSEQAKKVDELTQRVNEMADRISNLEHENYHLKADLQGQTELVDRVAQERDTTQIELNSAREHAHALAETIINRDSKVVELQSQVSNAEFNANQAEHELGVSRNRVTDLELMAADLRQQLEHVTSDRDVWVGIAHEQEQKANEYKVHLDRIQSILNPPKSVEIDYQSQVA